MATAPVAAASLIARCGVARGTGQRPLGGLSSRPGTAWCGRGWLRRRGAPAPAALAGVQLGAFVASHRLAHRLGAWPSVLTAAAASGAAAALLGDRGIT